jgi:hypothetical protein
MRAPGARPQRTGALKGRVESQLASRTLMKIAQEKIISKMTIVSGKFWKLNILRMFSPAR